MAKFQMAPVILDGDVVTARLGSASGSANFFDDKEVGKVVKLIADSQYNLAAVGDLIEAFVSSVSAAPLDDFSVGGVLLEGSVWAKADGLQATPGVGAIAVGDFVVTGTVTAKGTVLPSDVKVCKSTVQPGGVPADLTEAGLMAKLAVFAWRVVSLGPVGTGAVGTRILIQDC